MIILLLIISIIAFGCYYFVFVKNIFKLFNIKNTKLTKILHIIVSILFTLLSFYLYSIIGIFLIYLAFTSMLVDLIILIIKKITKKELFNKPIIYVAYLIPLIVTISLCIYGSGNLTNIIKTEYSLETKKLLDKDYKILLLSDMHYGPILKKDKVNDLINEINNIKDIDIVILGGDIVEDDTSKNNMIEIFTMLSKIKSNYGIYYVYGNHDRQYFSKTYTLDNLNNTLKDNNITILNDNYIKINDYVTIVGREDKSRTRKSINEIIDKSILNSYIIVADHQPTEYKELNSIGADLIVSGHTHGGQIFPIGYMIDLVKTSDLSYGHKKINNLDAIVSSGVCGWGVPIRTQHHSEYVIINIKEK